MEQQDIRWEQRFQHFSKAYRRLDDARGILAQDPDNFLLQAGLIQTYEFTFELAWKTFKNYLEWEGFTVSSPRTTFRQAYQSGYIREGETWMKALNDRNLTSHAYDDEVAAEVVRNIQERYFSFKRIARMAGKTGLNEERRAMIRQILGECPRVRSAVLFGSRAKGTSKPASDIDLAVKGAEVSRADVAALWAAFEGSLLPFFVDVVSYEAIRDEALRAHIDRVGILIYTRSNPSSVSYDT